MTHNVFVKCPICNKVTRIRMPVGYIYRTPVRFHCGECDSLLTGEFIVDNEKGAYKYVPKNCEEVALQDCDYFGEFSGEMLCNKVEPFHATGPDSMLPPWDALLPYLISWIPSLKMTVSALSTLLATATCLLTIGTRIRLNTIYS